MASEQLWWLSFASGRFLGVAIVRADSLASAVAKTHALRINPGGDVLGMPMPREEAKLVRPEDIGRLLSKKETERYQGGKTIREREEEGQTLRSDIGLQMAHAACNDPDTAAALAAPIDWSSNSAESTTLTDLGGSSVSSSDSSSPGFDTPSPDSGGGFTGGGGDVGGGGASSDW